MSSTGADLQPARAFESCIGESIEYVSQLESAHHQTTSIDQPAVTMLSLAERAALAAMLNLPDEQALLSLSWIRAIRVADGAETVLPADLCLRRPMVRRVSAPAAPQSIGCATGVTVEDAVLHGLLEVIERDAAALWWRGGLRPATIPTDPWLLQEAYDLVSAIRHGSRKRTMWLLDITTDVRIPCVAALSVNAVGYELACGFAARLSLGAAACAAIKEMCQWELGYGLIKLKRAVRPGVELNADELRQVQRGALVADECPLLHPASSPRHHNYLGELDTAASIASIVSNLKRIGREAYYTDLTRPDIGIPAVRVVIPGLQLDPSRDATTRLRACLRLNPLPLDHPSEITLH